jgi:hypothetical protein
MPRSFELVHRRLVSAMRQITVNMSELNAMEIGMLMTIEMESDDIPADVAHQYSIELERLTPLLENTARHTHLGGIARQLIVSLISRKDELGAHRYLPHETQLDVGGTVMYGD